MSRETIRVLIADDESTVIEGFRSDLMLDRTPSYHYLVEYTTRPDDVTDKIRSFDPHVVLLDDQFENKKVGIDELLPRISGQFPDVKVIVVTAHRGADTEPIRRALGWQAHDFLDKANLTPALLREKVQAAYQAYKEEEQNL